MRYDTSPTARALLALEAIQDSPGITAQRLGDHLGRHRARRAPLRRHPPRGRPADRVGHRSARRLPGRPWAPSAAADVHGRRGPRPRHGRARGPPRRCRPDRARRGRPLQDPARAPPAGRRTGAGGPPGDRPAARPEPARRPCPDGPARRGLHVVAPGPPRLPPRGRPGAADGGRPVGRRPASRPVVPPRLVADERRPARPAGRPGPVGLHDVAGPSRRPRTSTPSAPSRSTCPRAGATTSTCCCGPTSTRPRAGSRAASDASRRSRAASGCGPRPTSPSGTPASSPSPPLTFEVIGSPALVQATEDLAERLVKSRALRRQPR